MHLEMPENFDENSAPECLGIDEAVKRFENVMLSQIYIQQRFGARLRHSIRIGMAILFLLVISLFILSITLSTQMRLARESLVHMNNQFATVSENMKDISLYMKNMEQQVAFLPKINNVTAEMDRQMSLMNRKLSVIQHEMGGNNWKCRSFAEKYARDKGLYATN